MAKTKKDSVRLIEELNLNRFEEDVFGVKDLEKIKAFFDKTNAEEYCLRDPNKAGGKFYFVKDYSECLKILPKYKSSVTICVSANPYKEDIVLLGDIKVKKGISEDVVDITARTDSNATHRNIYQNPEINKHTNLEDNSLWAVPGFSKIMAYISEHELYDMVVEFVVYDCPVGVNKEKVAIFELRSEY